MYTLPDTKNSLKTCPGVPPPPPWLPTCLSLRDTWCPIWRPQAGPFASTQGIYSQSGPEPGSGIDCESRVVGVSLLLWLGRIMCGQCASWHCPCHCGENIFIVAGRDGAVTETSLPQQLLTASATHTIILSTFTSSVCGVMIRVTLIIQDRSGGPAPVAWCCLGTEAEGPELWHVRSHTTATPLPDGRSVLGVSPSCRDRAITCERQIHYEKNQEEGFYLPLKGKETRVQITNSHPKSVHSLSNNDNDLINQSQ